MVVMGAVAVVLLVWLTYAPEPRADVPDVGGAAAPMQAPPAGEPVLDAAPRRDPSLFGKKRPSLEAPPGESVSPEDPEATGEDMYSDPLAEAWSNVDLEAVRRAMPDNLYFKLSAPTKDEAVLEERAAERARWNVEYGKMLSGTATEEEIRSYYDQQVRLSGDYVEFTTYLLDHHRETLPERDVGLLELARRLHLARLEEIPRKVEETRERKREQDEARAAWLADEAEFERAQAEAAGSVE